MEENVPERTAEPAVVQTEQKKKTPALTIIFAILALAGIGFGGFELWQNMKKDDVIKNLQAEKKDEEEKENEIAEEDEKIKDEQPSSVNMNGGPYIRDGYFYVPDWGLKFKIPAELAGVGYSVDPGFGDGTVIGFSGYLKKDKVEYAQDVFYDRIDTCAILSVMKKNEQGGDVEGALAGGGIKQFDGYRLYMWGYEARNSCDIKLNIDETKATIREMFSNPENI